MEAALGTLLRETLVEGCDRHADRPVRRAYRLVLLGAPGVGKGTQAELLKERFRACHLSTGDIFRSARHKLAEDLSPGMATAIEFMHRGELVPDDIVVRVVAECTEQLTCPYGFLLDGFPRTVAQAEALKGILARHALKLDAVLDYELPREQVLRRISGRRLCSKCGISYHMESRRPKVSGFCDNCDAPVIQRDDDREEAVRVRLETYAKRTAPLIDFYRREGLLVTVQCGETPDVTFARSLEGLAKLTGA